MKNLLLPTLIALSFPAAAAQPDVLPVKQISLELARDIAMGAVEACRGQGYNVSAVVLDRAGNVQAALRDTLAARHTLEIAERKAGNARVVLDSLGPAQGRPVEVRLDDAQAQAWLRTLTDIRLVLAAGLGIEHDGDEGDVHDLESATSRAVYDWLAAVQEFLVLALTRAARR